METKRLTKDDIKALKQATDISFHFTDGVHTIQPTKRLHDPVYGDHSVSGKIEVAGIFDDYGKNCRENPIKSAYFYSGSCKFDPDLQSVLGLLKVNDKVSLHWTANNDTESMKEAGFATDFLSIMITREGKTSRPKVMRFLVGYSVTHADSTARMCRR